MEDRIIEELAADVHPGCRAERDLAWVKAAVMNNKDVCQECKDEIARAVGWEED